MGVVSFLDLSRGHTWYGWSQDTRYKARRHHMSVEDQASRTMPGQVHVTI